jgi:sodium transport system ATP-binding protein
MAVGFLTADLKLDEFFTPEYLFDFFMSLRGLSKEKAAQQKKFFFEGFGIGDCPRKVLYPLKRNKTKSRLNYLYCPRS